VMAVVKSATGDYVIGFLLLAATAVAALLVLHVMGRQGASRERGAVVA